MLKGVQGHSPPRVWVPPCFPLPSGRRGAPLPGVWGVLHATLTKGVHGSPCRRFGAVPILLPKGVQGSPCRGFGGVPQPLPLSIFSSPSPRRGEGVGG